MAGPIFVVELEPGLWMNAGNYSTDSFEKAQHFPSEIQAQSRLDYYRRYHYWRNAKIVRTGLPWHRAEWWSKPASEK